MRRYIYTHVNVDLDAVASAWFARTFIPGLKTATVVFVPADWDGEGMSEEDIAVDIPAGGRGTKFYDSSDGTRHSCFMALIIRAASNHWIDGNDLKALEPLQQFIDAQDTYGNAIEYLAPEINENAKNVLGLTGLNAQLRALQTTNPDDDEIVFERMSEMLTGFYRIGRSHIKAKSEAHDDDVVEIVGEGKVAIVRNANHTGTGKFVYQERGVLAKVYVDGNNIGITMAKGVRLRADHPEIQAVIEAAGETGEWHSTGWLNCRGSRKSPSTTPSKVNPKELAEVAASLL